MSRRALIPIVAWCLALAVAAPALGAAGSYAHVWEAQSLFGGEVGQFEARVVRSLVDLERDADRYDGTVRYHDVVALSTDSGVRSQEAVIELLLEGVPVSVATIGGTFSGTVTLTDRDASDRDDALGPPASAGTVTVYEVTGHWGAMVEGDVATGEILYETAVPRSTPLEDRDVRWFNRSGFANPDGLGDAQTFETVIAVAGGPGTGEQTPGGTSTSPGGSAPLASTRGTRFANVFAYVKKGLAGEDAETFGWPAPDSVSAARALRDARPAGARALPGNAVSIDIEWSGAYLDAKNRAAGLLGDAGPVFEDADTLADDLSGMRRGAPGIPALPPGVDAGRFWADYATQTIRSLGEVAGVRDLIAELELVQPGLDPGGVLAVRSTAMTALGVYRGPFGSVLGGVAACAAEVARAPLSRGAPSDAVLAAARDPRTPGSASVVEAFERVESFDVARDDEGGMAALPGTVMRGQAGPGIGVSNGGGTRVFDPPRWLAYRRADGAVYRIAEGQDVALVEASLLGWAYSETRGALVDSGDVGVVLAYAPYQR